jgi:hypothetical protein
LFYNDLNINYRINIYTDSDLIGLPRFLCLQRL